MHISQYSKIRLQETHQDNKNIFILTIVSYKHIVN